MSYVLVFAISYLFITTPAFAAPQSAPTSEAPKGILAGTPTACITQGNCTLNDMVNLVIQAVQWILGITGSLALLMFVYGGFVWLTAGGVEERVTKGKTIFKNAVVGIAIAFGAWTLIQFGLQAIGFKKAFQPYQKTSMHLVTPVYAAGACGCDPSKAEAAFTAESIEECCTQCGKTPPEGVVWENTAQICPAVTGGKAGITPDEAPQGGGLKPFPSPISKDKTVAQVLGDVVKGMLGIVGSIALVMFLYGGVLWMTAAGNDDQIKKGRATVVWAAIGLFVIFASYSIVQFIFKKVAQ